MKIPRSLPLMGLLLVALALRLIGGVFYFYVGVPALDVEPKDWWDSGYWQLGTMAINLAEGRGLNFVDAAGEAIWARRPPLYPLLLAAEYSLFGRTTLVPILVQSLVGTGTVLVTFLIGRELFGRRAGYLAAALAAFYPYYVAHDTAHQESSLFTLLSAVATLSLLRAASSSALRGYLLSGLALGLASLVKESLLAFLPFGALWLWWNAPLEPRQRAGAFLALILGFSVVVAPWLVRNARTLGSPVFTVGLGRRLWEGHNPFTLAHYPWESIDKSAEKAMASWTPQERLELSRLGELESDRWLMGRALEFIREHPAAELRYAAAKAYAGLGPFISPSGASPLRRAVYTASYGPVLLLALAGAVLGRSRWRELSIFYFLFISFLGVSVVAYAHTAHRTYLDIYLMILAAYGVLRILGAGGAKAGIESARGVPSRLAG